MTLALRNWQSLGLFCVVLSVLHANSTRIKSVSSISDKSQRSDNKLVGPDETSDDEDECETDIATRIDELKERTDAYSKQCQVDEFEHVSWDGKARKFFVTEEGYELICKKSCKNLEVFAKDAPDSSSLFRDCREHKQALRTIAAHDALDAARKACPEDDCVDLIMGAAASMHDYVAKFSDLCDVGPEDVIEDGLSLNEAAEEKICKNVDCMTSPVLAKPPSLEALEELAARCPDEASQSAYDYAKPGFDIGVSFFISWSSCAPITDANVSTPSLKKCPNPSMTAHNCGYDGEYITEDICNDRGCCWDPPGPKLPGRNWCYKDSSQVECEKRCPVEQKWNPQHRNECKPFLLIDKFIKDHPDPQVRSKGCGEVGCCWGELDHGSSEPWCFVTPCLA